MKLPWMTAPAVMRGQLEETWRSMNTCEIFHIQPFVTFVMRGLLNAVAENGPLLGA